MRFKFSFQPPTHLKTNERVPRIQVVQRKLEKTVSHFFLNCCN